MYDRFRLGENFSLYISYIAIIREERKVVSLFLNHDLPISSSFLRFFLSSCLYIQGNLEGCRGESG